jgi:hypothetical protein
MKMSPRREMDKSELVKKIVASLVESLEVLDKAAR